MNPGLMMQGFVMQSYIRSQTWDRNRLDSACVDMQCQEFNSLRTFMACVALQGTAG